MSTQPHEGRRKARALTIEIQYDDSSTTDFTDTADYACENTKTGVIATPTSLIASITLRMSTILEAEERALAPAIMQTQATIIITYPQAACPTYTYLRISKLGAQIRNRTRH